MSAAEGILFPEDCLFDEQEAVRVVAGDLPLSLSSKPGLRFGLR